MNSTAAVEIAAAAADARAQDARMRASYSTKYGYPFWGLRRLEAPVDLLAEEDGHMYKFFISLFGSKYTYHPKYGWSTGINYTTRYKDMSGVAFSSVVTTDAVEAATVVLIPVAPEDQKESVEPAEEIPTEIPTETPAAPPAAPPAAEPILLPKPTAASLPAQAPPSVDIEPSPPSPKELDQAVEPQQEPTSTPESPQAQAQEQGPQTPPAEERRSLSQCPEASSEYSESDEAESRSDQAEEEQDQSAQGGSSSR